MGFAGKKGHELSNMIQKKRKKREKSRGGVGINGKIQHHAGAECRVSPLLREESSSRSVSVSPSLQEEGFGPSPGYLKPASPLAARIHPGTGAVGYASPRPGLWT